MTELGISGFWSYAHADDEPDKRVTQLASDLRMEVEALTASPLYLVVDRETLDWGDRWRERLSEAVAVATLLIPVVTPRFFKSQACRDEVLAFSQAAKAAGREDLILPIYWITDATLESGPSQDEVRSVVSDRQWSDLREARLADRDSSLYRTAVNRLASSLVERSERLAATVVQVSTRPRPPKEVAAPAPPAEDGEDDGKTDSDEITLEDLAAGEAAMQQLTANLEALGAEVNAVGAIMDSGTAQIEESDRSGKPGFASRLRVAQAVAHQLEEPADRIAMLGHDFAVQLQQTDPLVRYLIAEAHGARDQAARDERDSLFAAVAGLVSESSEALQSLSEMIETAKATARQSSTMRPVIARMNRGLQSVLDGKTFFDDWQRRIDDPDYGSSSEAV